jgi:hypothetical protein
VFFPFKRIKNFNFIEIEVQLQEMGATAKAAR